jgi:signal transduction histidine kinase
VALKLTTNRGALPEAEKHPLIGLAVEDTGAGIPMDEHAMLFESL